MKYKDPEPRFKNLNYLEYLFLNLFLSFIIPF